MSEQVPRRRSRSDPPDTQLPEPEPTDLSTSSIIEAMLFASDEPLTEQRIVEVLGTGTSKRVRQCIAELNERYERHGSAFRIERLAGGYRMLTLPQYNVWLAKLLRIRDRTKLSQAALETLAIIAYKQPVTRAQIEAIRGVAAGEMVRNLMDKGLVKIVGRAEELGRPLLYGTTKRFLDVFGLASLADLPQVEQLKRP